MAQASRRKRGNWGDIRSPAPIPGNVFACMEELGIQGMRQMGDEIAGNCPMHFERLGKEDKHSSWSVNAEEGFFNCFSCGYKGPFVLLVQDVLKVSWEDAAAWVRERGSIERARRLLTAGEYIHEITGPIDTSKQINEASLALFVDPPEWALKERSLDLGAVRDLGIRWNTDRGCWILPIRDPDTGMLLGWQEKAKKWVRNRPKDVQKSNTLFGLEIHDADYAVPVESPLDVARVNHALGENAALGTYGSSLSATQMELIVDRVDTVIWLFDNPDLDTAGWKEAKRLQKEFLGNGVTTRYGSYKHTPTAKDPGDMSDLGIVKAVEDSYSSLLARF